jgi:hypothetical protein
LIGFHSPDLIVFSDTSEKYIKNLLKNYKNKKGNTYLIKVTVLVSCLCVKLLLQILAFTGRLVVRYSSKKTRGLYFWEFI